MSKKPKETSKKKVVSEKGSVKPNEKAYKEAYRAHNSSAQCNCSDCKAYRGA